MKNISPVSFSIDLSVRNSDNSLSCCLVVVPCFRSVTICFPFGCKPTENNIVGFTDDLKITGRIWFYYLLSGGQN